MVLTGPSVSGGETGCQVAALSFERMTTVLASRATPDTPTTESKVPAAKNPVLFAFTPIVGSAARRPT